MRPDPGTPLAATAAQRHELTRAKAIRGCANSTGPARPSPSPSPRRRRHLQVMALYPAGNPRPDPPAARHPQPRTGQHGPREPAGTDASLTPGSPRPSSAISNSPTKTPAPCRLLARALGDQRSSRLAPSILESRARLPKPGIKPGPDTVAGSAPTASPRQEHQTRRLGAGQGACGRALTRPQAVTMSVALGQLAWMLRRRWLPLRVSRAACRMR